MAFIKVDFPAPLVPIRPTISSRRTSRFTPATATLPPNATLTSVTLRVTSGSGSSLLRRLIDAGATVLDAGAASRPMRRSANDTMPLRALLAIWMNPPGKYINMMSRPTDEVNCGTSSLLGKKAGRPITHSAPRMAPVIEPSPPITAMPTTSSDSPIRKWASP